MINLRYFCFVVIQLYLKVRALALFYFINLHHYTYITLVSVGDTSGLRIRCPSRCTWVQILIKYTSGWANIGHFRCIAKNCQNKIHRNSVIHGHPDVSKFIIHRKSRFSSNPDVSQLISREYTRFPTQCIPAQAGKNKQNTSEFRVFIQSRCISDNFPRIYLHTLVVYSRAGQPQEWNI